MRMSYSSSQLLQGCARKYYYKKIIKKEIDPDVSEDTTALRVGSCYHDILENSLHGEMDVTREAFDESFKKHELYGDLTLCGMIEAMVIKYIEMHQKTKLSIVACEEQIGDDDIIGYVDAIMKDAKGGWYICDLKTAAWLSGSLLSRLSLDPQLNLYSYYADIIASTYNLDVKKFKGVLYRVTTKCKIKKLNKESNETYIGRCLDRIEAYSIFIPTKDLIPEKVHADMMRLLGRAQALKEVDEAEVPQNFGYCEQYFKPCEYWSNCYGNTFSGASQGRQLMDSTNAVAMVSSSEEVEEDDFDDLFDDDDLLDFMDED